MVVFGQSSCFGANVFFEIKMVVLGLKWLYLDKSGCFREKVVEFGQSGCIRASVLVIGQSGCIRAKVVVFGQSG